MVRYTAVSLVLGASNEFAPISAECPGAGCIQRHFEAPRNCLHAVFDRRFEEVTGPKLFGHGYTRRQTGAT